MENRNYSTLDLSYTLDKEGKSLKPNLKANIPSKYSITLDIFGSLIYIEAKHYKFIKEMREFIGSRETTLWKPYDYKIYSEWESLDKFFYRARPLSDNNTLNGIFIESGNELKIWNSHRPPFPPTDIGIFNNKIAVFHSAALEYAPGKALLILGNQRTGKTTLSIELVNNYNYSLLTDEVSYFLNGKNLVEPFPRWFNLVDNNNTSIKNVISADQLVSKISPDPVKVDKLIFLNKSKTLTTKHLNSHEAIQNLLSQSFNMSQNPNITIDTIFRLVRNSKYILIDVVDYSSLNKVAKLVDEWATNYIQKSI